MSNEIQKKDIIFITEDGTDNIIWNEMSKKHLLESYDDGDSIYDNL